MSRKALIIVLCGMAALGGAAVAARSWSVAKSVAPRLPVDASSSAAYMKTYERGGYRIEAGFMPYQESYVWGEPVKYLMFVVRNAGKRPISFYEDDCAGHRCGISGVDSDGKSIDYRGPIAGDGPSGTDELRPGQTFRERMPLARSLAIPGPGAYTVTVGRALALAKSFEDPYHVGVYLSNTFKLTILPYTSDRMAKAIHRLAARIRAREHVVPDDDWVFGTFSLANQQSEDLATLAALAAKEPAALDELGAMARHAPVPLRAAALRYFVPFSTKTSLYYAYLGLCDSSRAVRRAVYRALGSMHSDTAASMLISCLNQAPSDLHNELLRAVGGTRSPRAIGVLLDELRTGDLKRSCAAVDGIAAFGGDTAIRILRGELDEDDLDLREHVISQWVETLHQPLDPHWLMPVVKSRKRANAAGATRLMRYGGPEAVAAAIGCLDFRNPSTRGSYNWRLLYEQAWFDGGMRIPWVSDLNREGTPQEIEQNRTTLRRLKVWLKDHERHPLVEELPTHREIWWEELKHYGAEVDSIRVRLQTNQTVWPPAMPQLLKISLARGGAPVGELDGAPALVEAELNGTWYRREPRLTTPTDGAATGGGASFGNLILDEHWLSISGGRPLRLVPGEYTVRVRLSLRPESRRTGLAISNSVRIRILAETWRAPSVTP